MTELITIITVGVALAGLILTLAGFQAVANRETRCDLVQLNQRVAHIEGLLEGLAGSKKISL